ADTEIGTMPRGPKAFKSDRLALSPCPNIRERSTDKRQPRRLRSRSSRHTGITLNPSLADRPHLHIENPRPRYASLTRVSPAFRQCIPEADGARESGAPKPLKLPRTRVANLGVLARTANERRPMERRVTGNRRLPSSECQNYFLHAGHGFT